tara:strand:+ start:195 stop:857 length:663 start_codon:yes stop_codon:yes gene_type:complete
LIKLENVYLDSLEEKILLKDVSFFIASGSLISIKSPPSLGKTKLMKAIAMIDKPKSGNIFVMGKNISKLRGKEIAELRRKVSIVFEEDLFIDELNVYDNILFPLVFRNENSKEINLALKELVPWLNLGKIINRSIKSLSKSEKKIVQFARAIIVRPRILLLDDFFYSIDKEAEKKIIYLIMALNRIGTSIVIFGRDSYSYKINFNNKFIIKDKSLLEVKN